jgi:hypothetical protein
VSHLLGLAHAARPLAGGSPDFARGRAVQTGRSVAALSNQGYACSKLTKPTPVIAVAPRLRCTFCPVSIKSMARSVQARAAVQQAQEVRPNPSIERTSTGLAREAPQVHVPLRGPIRFRPAHVKR